MSDARDGQPPDDFPELQTVDDDLYRLGEEVARGGQGRILLAHDRRLGRTVAIKELHRDDPEHEMRFEREARITAQLQHPGIVAVYEAGRRSNGRPFFAMRMVDGRSLGQILAEKPPLEARLGLLPELLVAIEAVAYAHSREVIHRDLSPRNILLGEFGEVVVLDWGLAKKLGTQYDPTHPLGGKLTVEGSVMGTPAFMSPEQAGGEEVDHRTDVYALGAILYYLLAGTPAYTGSNPLRVLTRVIKGPPPSLASRATTLPRGLVDIVDRAMAWHAKDRYLTARELADALKRFQIDRLADHRFGRLNSILQRLLNRAAV